ncbi:MAG TPA: hypothetical protein DCX07_05045 [Phycisphaerales bacterium]|nr:hypothetical protein [Phycisphaerales bacterium]
MSEISEKAMIEKGARIAPDAKIGPFAYIGAEVSIGPGCVIENSATIVGHTKIGERTHVFPMAVVGAPGEGDRPGKCIVGAACALREHVTVYAGEERATKIGKNNLIMIGSQVGAGAVIDDHGIFANFTHVGVGAHVQEYVRTSGFSFVADAVTVGAYTFIAGFAEVDRNAPPFAMIQGSPYRVRGVNSENLHRCGFGEDDVRALKQAFRELFNGGSTPADLEVARRLLADASVNPHVRRLAEFVQQSGGFGSPCDAS